MTDPTILSLPDGRRLAYHRTEGASPGVLFCGGFKSDMTGSKATALEAFCRERGQAFVRFDYTGHGQSSGSFRDGSIGDWTRDALDILDQLTHGPQVVVGSSMGGWIMLKLALARPERLRALVGIASAPDFTERLIWEQFTDAQRAQMQSEGEICLPSCYGEEPYPITKRLIEEGRDHLLLHAPIAIHCPVRLIHGSADEDVPWDISAQLLQRLESPDVKLTLIKNGNHRLSEPAQLGLLCHTVGVFCKL